MTPQVTRRNCSSFAFLLLTPLNQFSLSPNMCCAAVHTLHCNHLRVKNLDGCNSEHTAAEAATQSARGKTHIWEKTISSPFVRFVIDLFAGLSAWRNCINFISPSGFLATIEWHVVAFQIPSKFVRCLWKRIVKRSFRPFPARFLLTCSNSWMVG